MKEGEVLRKWLDVNRLSKSEFAEKLDIHRNTLYAYFNTAKFNASVLDNILAHTGHSDINEMIAEISDERKTSSSTGRYKINPKNKGVPVYDVELTATAVESMDNYKALEPEYYLDIPFFRDCDFAGKVVGDSMFPRYRHGSIIVCKRITRWERFFEAGRAYLVITKSDNFRTVKYLQEDETDNDYLWLLSHNAEKFPPQRIPKDEILELYLVKGQIDQ